MWFNSVDFAFFLPLVFLIYWSLQKRQLVFQNIFLIIASYLFYGWWDWRFLFLIFFSSMVDYTIGILLQKQEVQYKRKLLLFVSILVNIGMLGFFKYYNFFAESFVEAFTLLGFQINIRSLNIILPVGISFYTFQTLGYTIDVYRRKFKPTKNLPAYLAYVSFFPQLVAGPIERAQHLLTQFLEKRHFDYGKALDGLRQMLWGLFKKVVIADNCAEYVNTIFSDYSAYSGSTLLLGGVFFAIQVYADFSGYSDIAIGVSRLFGFDLVRNFAYPFFSRDMAEFWRRWHISLTKWFQDYVYIPLGGSRVNFWRRIRNIFIVFFLIGLWHGADWNFVMWGLVNACFFIPLILMKRNRKYTDIVAKGRLYPSFVELFQMITTFLLFVISVIVFRSESIPDAFKYLKALFIGIFQLNSYTSTYHWLVESENLFFIVILFLTFLLEWFQRNREHALEFIKSTWYLRWFIYLLILAALIFMSGAQQEFFYFQF